MMIITDRLILRDKRAIEKLKVLLDDLHYEATVDEVTYPVVLYKYTVMGDYIFCKDAGCIDLATYVTQDDYNYDYADAWSLNAEEMRAIATVREESK